jgi:Lar family restriction alleviation protein
MDEEILPCPFCGCENVEEVMNDSLRSLECLDCHAQGPWVEDVLECPVEAWNSRTSVKESSS